MPNRRILLVEDHDAIRHGLIVLLERLGYAVTSAATVADGIQKSDGHDVALIDLRLPDGSGTEVLRHLRDTRSPAKVAVFSAGVTPDVMDAATRLNPERTFPKPFDLDALLAWIASASAEA